jgi:hypothetical protein
MARWPVDSLIPRRQIDVLAGLVYAEDCSVNQHCRLIQQPPRIDRRSATGCDVALIGSQKQGCLASLAEHTPHAMNAGLHEAIREVGTLVAARQPNEWIARTGFVVMRPFGI